MREYHPKHRALVVMDDTRAFFTKFDPLYPSRILLKPNGDWRILRLNWVNLSEKRSSRQLNRVVAMRHASLQRVGNQNMKFSAIVEYPFFTRSELSNGVQLADLLAYNVYRVFRNEDFSCPYFRA